MTIPAGQSGVTYHTGNGTASTFDYEFKITAEADLKVTQTDTAGVDTVLVLNTDYTVTGVGNNAGGSITLVAGALASNYTLAIEDNVEVSQLTPFGNQSAFYANLHEDAYDKNTRIARKSIYELDRVLKIPASVQGVDTELPKPEGLNLFRWNEDGTALENVETADLVTVAQFSNFKTDTFVDGVDFTAGTTTTVTLDSAPGTKANTQVYFDGVYQEKSEYSLGSTVITFDNPIPIGVGAVEVVYGKAADVLASSLREVQFGDGTTTAFTLANAYEPGNGTLHVYINGVRQEVGYGYTETSSTVLTFDSAPANGDRLLFLVNPYAPQTTADANNVTYTHPASGAVATNVGARLSQTISVKDFGATGDGTTDDTTAVQAAVTYANTNGLTLYWPKGTYFTTSSINNLHNVKHNGVGAIKRGANTFNAFPSQDDSNSIFVSTTGVAGNDGLSTSEPVPYTDVRSILTAYGPHLDGKWFIEFAAGTYSVSAAWGVRVGPNNEDESDPDDLALTENHITNANYVVFRGPDVGYDPATAPRPVPTAIFDGGGNATVLFDFRSGFRAYVKDIKFVNANGSSSSAGVSCINGALRCENVHTDNCYYGISGQEGCLLEVKGGDIDGNSNASYTGIRSLFLVKHDIGNQGAGAVGQGPFIHDCGQGFFVQEGSTGHSDYVTYEDNVTAIRCRVNSRVNASTSEFKRNTVGIVVDTGSNVGFGDDANFYLGGVDANDTPYTAKQSGTVLYSGSESSSGIKYGIDYKLVAADVISSTTAGTAENFFATINFPRGIFDVTRNSTILGKKLKVKVAGVISGTTSTKAIKLRLEEGSISATGTLLFAFNALNEQTGQFVWDAEVFFSASNSQYCMGKFCTLTAGSTGQSVRAYNDTAAIDVSIDDFWELQLVSQCSDAADSLTVDYYEVSIAGAI